MFGIKRFKVLLAATLALTVAISGLNTTPASKAEAGAFDVAVGEIHVTQGIQHTDPLFWVPLVAERSTAVRIQVEHVYGTPGPVTGKLRVWVDGIDITNGGVDDINRTFPTPHNQFIPPANPRRSSDLLEFEEHTLNFELLATDNPLMLPSGQNESNNVYFEVEIFAEGDADSSNNTGRTGDLTVKRRATPWLFKTQVFYFPGGPAQWPVPAANRPEESFIIPEVGDAMAPALWPIPDAATNQIFPPIIKRDRQGNLLWTSGTFFRLDCDGDGKITYPSNCQGVDEPASLLHKFQQRRQLWVNGGFGPDRLVYDYGWVRDGFLSGHDGVAILGGNIGYGMDRAERGQKTFAHEFGHMLGLPHNSPGRTVSHYGWDVGQRLHNNPNAMRHGITGRVKPLEGIDRLQPYSDVMNESGITNTADTWMDLENYASALDSPKLEVDSAKSYCQARNPNDFETVVVYGVPIVPIREKTGLQIIARTFKYPWCTDPEATPSRPNLELGLIIVEPGAKVKSVRIPIEARMIIDLPKGEGSDEKLGPFAAPIPVPKGTKVHGFQIKSLEDDRILAKMEASESAPKITILSPKPKETIGEKVTVRWNAGDSDKGSALTYQVAYSPNGGRDFIPLEVNLDGTSLTIYREQLPDTGDGSGLIRVFVNDGVNTSFADVYGLSVKR